MGKNDAPLLNVGCIVRIYQEKFVGNGWFENLYIDYTIVEVLTDPNSEFMQLINGGAMYKCEQIAYHRTIHPLPQNQMQSGLSKGSIKVLSWGDKSELKDDYFQPITELSDEEVDEFCRFYNINQNINEPIITSNTFQKNFGW